MRHFKKRTIALVLASVITVAGSFAAENYKNSLMSLKFGTTADGAVSMSVETKTPYAGNVTPIKRDENTYILTLAEMNNLINGSIKLEEVAGRIVSVDIKTLPYTNSAKGYTRVTIKTQSPTSIIGQNKIFIPARNQERATLTSNKNNEKIVNRKNSEETHIPKEKKVREDSPKVVPQPEPVQEDTTVVENEVDNSLTPASSVVEENIPVTSEMQNYKPKENDPFAALMVGLGTLLLFAFISAFGLRAKNRLQEITGERLEIDLDENEEKSKGSKRKQIKNTIKKLDSIYSKSAVTFSNQEYNTSKPKDKAIKPAEKLNVVDLDELFKEQQLKAKDKEPFFDEKIEDQDDLDHLEDFLSEFSFDEEEPEVVQVEETVTYDEEYYDKVINNKELKFTTNDIICMSQLLNLEIDSDVLKHKEKFVKKSLFSKPKKTPKQILEDLVTTYKISQNISFSEDDIGALKKLISVEIDSDFVTDLRTNPERIKQVQAEIVAAKSRPLKPSKILTLNVKDMLPDLSEALKKQGNRRIESEVKPVTVYASEGYEVSTLSVNFDLPDLSKEINNKSAYVEKPSAAYDIVDNSYEVATLNLKDSLPDLSEALKNPKNFENPEPETVEVDEESLIKNIDNVQFRPFDDGTREFEIINEQEPQNESNQVENIEAGSEDFYNLDNSQKEISNIEETANKMEFSTESSDELMKKIEKTKLARAERREKILQRRNIRTKTEENNNSKTEIKCIFEGVTYTVLSTTEFAENKGCHLAKANSGYAVLGYIEDRFFKIAEFETLKSEHILSRLSENLPDGSKRYFIRIGLDKFMVNVSDDSIEYMIAL